MDTSIVTNTALRNLLNQGAGYRENVNVDYTQDLFLAFDHFTKFCCAKYNVAEAELREFGAEAEADIKKQLSPPRTNLSVLEDSAVPTALKELKKDFVITTVDKASKNFAFICKHYYKHVLQTELHAEDGA